MVAEYNATFAAPVSAASDDITMIPPCPRAAMRAPSSWTSTTGRPAVDVDRREQGREVHVEEPADRRPRRVRDEQTDLEVADGVPHRVEQALGRLTEVDDRVATSTASGADRSSLAVASIADCVAVEDHEVDPRRRDLAAVLGAQADRSTATSAHGPYRPANVARSTVGSSVVVGHRRTVPVARARVPAPPADDRRATTPRAGSGS